MQEQYQGAFDAIKPYCDALMVNPTPVKINDLLHQLEGVNDDVLQDMQLYIMFPFVTQLKHEHIRGKYELIRHIVDGMRGVLTRSKITSSKVFKRYLASILLNIYDKENRVIVDGVPEELKLSMSECVRVMMLNLTDKERIALFRNEPAVVAQIAYILIHMTKLERLRALRLSALKSLTAFTGTHQQFLDTDFQFKDKLFENAACTMTSYILPGVLAVLQEVAVDKDNPGHAVIVAAVRVIHLIVGLVMNSRNVKGNNDVKVEDFTKIMNPEPAVKKPEKKVVPRTVADEFKDNNCEKRSEEWYAMAGDKLKRVTMSLRPLQMHEHRKVRKELAVYCSRIMFECSTTMQPSLPMVLDILLSLSRDTDEGISMYCQERIDRYFKEMTYNTKQLALQALIGSMVDLIEAMPRILNNIDSARKLASLNLLHGYIRLLCTDERPQQLTLHLSLQKNVQSLNLVLIEAATLERGSFLLNQIATRDLSNPPPRNSPWCKFTYLDTSWTMQALQAIYQQIGNAECAEIMLDYLLEMISLADGDHAELAYILNYLGSAPDADDEISTRVLNKYLDEKLWFRPLEITSTEKQPTPDETLDPDIYNPRSWIKDFVPGLFEGATETRYTDIPIDQPRQPKDPEEDKCPQLSTLYKNMLLSCLLTEGVGMIAKKLKERFQPYLLPTLSLILERVGSKYEMIHLAGVKAINDIATACGHTTVGELIHTNADYFTYYVTVRLRKSWNSSSALQILTVVMEYSDATIIDCIYDILHDVLMQSCDSYHWKNLTCYLRVFLTFVTCVKKWYPTDIQKEPSESLTIDILSEAIEYCRYKRELEGLLNSNQEDDRDVGKSAEEMFKEDEQRREDELLDYDDSVKGDKPPLPRYIRLTMTILKRCCHYISSRHKDERILAMHVLNEGFPLLRDYQEELLPLIHNTWSPLVVGFKEVNEPVVLRRSFELFVTMANLAKDFIRNRAIKEVVTVIFKFIDTSSKESYLKDVGSAYRDSNDFKMQIAFMTHMPKLVVDLTLDGEYLKGAMDCMQLYLSNRQPKPLQELAVKFFKEILKYDYGAAWNHLRLVCDNRKTLEPPQVIEVDLNEVTGTPYEPTSTAYRPNINKIFDVTQ